MSRSSEGPLIFNIRRFALDDGPGIRTTVFLKGCPLRCAWCHNPESWSPDAEIAYYQERCIGCGDCSAACPIGAVHLDPELWLDRRACIVCGACAEACPTTALRLVGQNYPVSRLIDALLADAVFYETSGGGVTFSGGEPALFMDYVAEVAAGLKRQSIHTAIQTAGMFDLEEFRSKLLPIIDLIFFDIKLFDPEKHREYTGYSNERMLYNFLALVRAAPGKIVPRVPLVPGVTATEENLAHIADFLRGAGCDMYALLPYNPGGVQKSIATGKKELNGFGAPMSLPEANRWSALFQEGMRGGTAA